MNCLNCGHVLDDFSSLESQALPKEGDVSICFYCSHLAIYTGNLMDLREPTPEELEECMAKPTVLKALAMVALAHELGDM